MAAEVISFSDIFDASITLATELTYTTNRTVPLQWFNDNKSLFDALSKGPRASEKPLMVDISAAREGYKSGCISYIGFVRSHNNMEDGLTKPMSQAALRNVLSTGTHIPIFYQWILRPVEAPDTYSLNHALISLLLLTHYKIYCNTNSLINTSANLSSTDLSKIYYSKYCTNS